MGFDFPQMAPYDSYLWILELGKRICCEVRRKRGVAVKKHDDWCGPGFPSGVSSGRGEARAGATLITFAPDCAARAALSSVDAEST